MSYNDRMRYLLENSHPNFKGVLPAKPDARDWTIRSAGIPQTRAYEIQLQPVHPAKNQEDAGTCVGQAYAQGNSIYQYAERGIPEEFSAGFIYSECKRIDSFPPGTEGTDMRSGAKVLVSKGVPLEAVVPYRTDKLIHEFRPEVYQAALPNRCASYARVNNLEELGQCLAAGKPVMLAFMVFSNILGARNGVVPRGEGAILGFHAVTAIGKSTSKQLVTCIGSWGKHPCTDNGLHHLPFSYFTELLEPGLFDIPLVMDMFVMTDVIVPKTPKVLTPVKPPATYINGKLVEGVDVPSVLMTKELGGRIYLAGRLFSEEMGCRVEYDEATNVVNITTPDRLPK